MGVYGIQLASLVFNDDKPTDIKAVGHLNEEGVDMAISASMAYTNGRTATIVLQALTNLRNEAFMIGTKGTIHLPNFWCPDSINLPNGSQSVALPKSTREFLHINAAGLVYEANEVRECLKKGKI